MYNLNAILCTIRFYDYNTALRIRRRQREKSCAGDAGY